MTPDPTLNRREALSALGAAAAGSVALAEGIAQEPIAKAEDKASAIKIAALRAFVVGTKAYVKIETNQKVTGWGEVTGLDPKVACALMESLFELLDGENPTRVEFLWQKLYRSHRDMRGGPFMVHCLSAIDMALWDITGKLHGVPVYRLLGGPTRDKIRMYPSAKAHKTGTGGPHPWSGGLHDITPLVKSVEHSRKMVGPDGAVMFDAHCAVPPPLLIQFCAAIEPYDVMWIEEPVVPGNIDAFIRLKQHIRQPLATGERDRTIWEVAPYLQHRCIDILQSDCGHCGGITQLRKIATLAETFYVPMAPHNTCSELGLTASLHATATIPLFLIHEGYLDGHIMPKGVARKNWEQDKDGYASLPQGPGLGVEVDESMFEKVNADPKRKYKWPKPTYADGSVRDY
ncbi:MAG: mandelate racemase/muconate lactonizing enzyme family protein [Gemmataceae bacterium]|nr:mandelate racemase/muconate lactonizing enzyme family protein [Gemmataceae bacterium]